MVFAGASNGAGAGAGAAAGAHCSVHAGAGCCLLQDTTQLLALGCVKTRVGDSLVTVALNPIMALN